MHSHALHLMPLNLIHLVPPLFQISCFKHRLSHSALVITLSLSLFIPTLMHLFSSSAQVELRRFEWQVEGHLEHTCSFRQVVCSWRCGIPHLSAAARLEHEQKRCLLREVECPLGAPDSSTVRIHSAHCYSETTSFAYNKSHYSMHILITVVLLSRLLRRTFPHVSC